MPQEIMKFRNVNSAPLFTEAALRDRRIFWLDYDAGKTPGSTSLESEFTELLKPNSRILDLGCGSGRTVRELENLGHKIEGIEINPKELNLAAEQTKGDANFSLAAGENLPFTNGAFDAVTMLGLLGGVDARSRKEILAEVARTLKPGGLVYSSQFARVEDNEEVMGAYSWDKQFTNDEGDMFVVDWQNKRVMFIDHHFRDDEINSLLTDAGFSRISRIKKTVRSQVGGREYPIISAWGYKK